MSSERSSSAVRSLRSIFENKANESSSDLRGRSPGGLSDFDNQRPRSKVRSNFIQVDLSKAAAAKMEATSEVQKEGSIDGRRGSFSAGKSGNVLEGVNAGASLDSAVSSTVATPLVEVGKQLGTKNGTQKQDKPAANPDKPVMGAEEEPASIRPADPASEAAVSGGNSLSSAAEDLRKAGASKKPTVKSSANGRPSVALKDVTKPASSAKSNTAQPKSPLSPLKAPLKKPSRSSLTAPTAASAARASAADKGASSTGAKVSSPPSKPRPRDVTKPIDVSSHLMAPTAASRARQDPAPAASKPVLASRPKATTTSSKSAPRASLAGRPDSGASQTSKSKLGGPPDGSFLERMTRPTAASTNKSQLEKTEVKSPPRKQNPAAPKPAAPAKPVPTKVAPAVSKPVKAKPEVQPAAQDGQTAQVTEEKPAAQVEETAPPKEEPKVEPAPAPAPTPAAVSEPAPAPKAEPEPTEAATKPAETPKAESVPQPEPEPVAEPEPTAEAEAEPAEEATPEAVPEPAAEEEEAAADEEPEAPAEAETPKPNGKPAEPQDTKLEATPAAISEEDSIR